MTSIINKIVVGRNIKSRLKLPLRSCDFKGKYYGLIKIRSQSTKVAEVDSSRTGQYL